MKLHLTFCCAFSLAFFSFTFFGNSALAQCETGEVLVGLEVHTDTWGYECYWEITPGGNACGVGTIASGGNTAEMGCASGGMQTATSDQGYASNAAILEGDWCLTLGETYTLHFVDDYSDGGSVFHVRIGGLELFSFSGSGAGNSWDFTVVEPMVFNAWLVRPIIYGYLHTNEDKIVSAELVNFGSANVFAIEASYSVAGSSPVTEVFTGFTLAPNDRHTITFSQPWTETELGVYDLGINISSINGNPDEDPSDNTLNEIVEIGNPIPDLIYPPLSGIGVPQLTIIGSIEEGVNKPTDLDFHPTLSRYELWVINRGTENTGGSTVIFHNAGQPDQTEEFEVDGNAWHFMSLPSGMAFGRNENWASSPSITDANHSGGYFTGPTLWSSDPDVYAEDSGGNGSHLDMIHQSPNSMGICNAGDNRFYLYDGYHDRIVWYDFVADHGPGNSDHSDGLVRKFTEPVLNNFNTTVPNHMVLDESTGWLYVCGNGGTIPRVIRLNTNTATETGTFSPLSGEELAETTTYTAEWEEFITEGLTRPCGIEMNGTTLLVGDYATGMIHAYETAGGTAIWTGAIDTGSDGIAGIKVGPDGKIWYVNYLDNTLMRVEDFSVTVSESLAAPLLSVFPNPAIDRITAVHNRVSSEDIYFRMVSATGAVVLKQNASGMTEVLNLAGVENGYYILELMDGGVPVARQPVVIRH